MVVSLDDPQEYLTDVWSLGACIGRHAGRISKGGFNIDEVFYPIHEVDGVHLHGGKQGFAKRYWQIEETNDTSVVLSYFSPHLEEGYPGNLTATVTYKLDGNNLIITHKANTDRTTVLNMTNHSYFRLDDAASIDNYTLMLDCGQCLETHENLLPTGKLLPVEGTEFDFRAARSIGETRMDTPFCKLPESDRIAVVSSAQSGIQMSVFSNQPACVIFTPPTFPAICFETQNLPDAPHFKHFPTSFIRPRENYINRTIFSFDLVI